MSLAEQGIAGALFDLGSTQQEQAARARGAGGGPGQGAMGPPLARAPPGQVSAVGGAEIVDRYSQ